MKRRTFLGVAAGAVGVAAGCTGDGPDPRTADDTPSRSAADGESGGSAPFEHAGTLDATFATNGAFPPDGDPSDGRPPTFPDPPAPPAAEPSTFPTLSVNGETVRLAPIDVVEAWYRRGEARFVDARGLRQYERAHVYAAVLSTAQPGSTGGGIDGWDRTDRVVTYCGCPHHLSSIRAAGLRKAGFERVYALDEGFGAWAERGYPMAGLAFADGGRASVREWVVTGSVDSRYAGGYVWVTAGRRYEAAPVREDGTYRVRVAFPGVSAGTTVRVRTPAGTVTKPLGAVAEPAGRASL